MITLQEFLLDAASKPFKWGVCDCCLFAADWILAARGVDPAADFRGTYSRACTANDLLILEGGLIKLTGKQMAALGFVLTDDAQAGDVGVVETMLGPTAAIRTASAWACKTQSGIATGPFKVYAAWRV